VAGYTKITVYNQGWLYGLLADAVLIGPDVE